MDKGRDDCLRSGLLAIFGSAVLLLTSACSIHTAITNLSGVSPSISENPSPPALNPLFILSSKDTSSVEDNDLTFSGLGGHPPFSFQLLQGLGALSSDTQTYVPAGLQKESIKVLVTDSAGQMAEKTITLNGFESHAIWNSSVPAHHQGQLTMQFINATNTWVVKDNTSFNISTDNGATWVNRPLTMDIKNSNIFAVDPVRSLIYFAGKSGKAWTVYKSADLGLTWSLIDSYGGNAGASETNFPRVIFVHPTTGLLFVGGQSVPDANIAFSSYGKAYVRRSADFGQTWTESDFFSELGPMSGYWGTVQKMELGPDGSIFHVGYVHWNTDASGFSCICYRPYIRKSTDNGLTWTTLTPFMRSSNYGGTTSVLNEIFAFSVSPTNVITVVAHEQNVNNGDNYVYIRQSADGGTTWSAGTDALGSNEHSFSLDPFTSEIYRYKLNQITLVTSSWTLDKSSNLGSSYVNVENYSENLNSTSLNRPEKNVF